MNLTCIKFHGLVQEEMFKNMTLKFSYDYNHNTESWMIPRLISLIEEQPKLAKYVKNVRLVVVPIPERIGSYLDRDPNTPITTYQNDRLHLINNKSTFHFLFWAKHVQGRMDYGQRVYPVSPCLSHRFLALIPMVPSADYLHQGLEYAASVLFCPTAHNVDGGLPMEQPMNYFSEEPREKRPIFAAYVLHSMLELLGECKKVRHLEAGAWPPLRERYPGSSTDHELLTSYGLAFATAMILTALPKQISSLRIHGLPLALTTPHDGATVSRWYKQIPDIRSARIPAQLARFSLEHVKIQTQVYAEQITNLDLDVQQRASISKQVDWNTDTAALGRNDDVLVLCPSVAA